MQKELHTFLTTELEVNGQLQAPAALSLEEDSLIPRVGLRTGQKGWRENKYLPLAEIEPRIPGHTIRKLVNIPTAISTVI